MLDKVSDISNGRMGESGKSEETILDYANQLSPVADLYRMDKDILKEYVASMAAQEDPNEEFILPPAPCGGITFTPNTAPTLKDMFGNRIRAIAQYGSDARNIYYIQYNSSKTVNSPIVVLVHGGAWFSGPNPNTTQGWHFGYTAGNAPADNIVLKMLNNGFVVVTMLYPLAAYGMDNPGIITNTTTVQTQMNSIDLAINHIRTNFPTCVNLNANSIQLLGESAGGHLALNWAYNSANTSYVKSVISMYAPTNMQQYGNYINMTVPFTCGTVFNLPNTNTTPIHFPWNFPMDINDLKKTFNASNTATTCNISNNPPPDPHIYDLRILKLYNAIQSSYAQLIPTPLTNSTLLTYSPYNALNSSKIVPTFIMHGSADFLVPYSSATNSMDTKLDNTGGLIFNYSNSGTGTSIPTVYNTLADKHGIKIYTNGDHGFRYSGPFSLIRGDIIKWLNGHK